MSDDFYIDSGASSHMTNKRDWIANERPTNKGNITVANNSSMQVKCMVDIEVNLDRGNKHTPMTVDVKNVLYVPTLCTNLLSVSQMAKIGKKVLFSGQICEIFDDKWRLIGIADMVNDMYKLRLKNGQAFLVNMYSRHVAQTIWTFGERKVHSISNCRNCYRNEFESGIR